MKTRAVNRLLKECAFDETCAYLEGRKQQTHYKIISECTSAYCDQLIRRGWRRFGEMFFRPVCHECHACESVRIDVGAYRFSRSEKRTLRKNSDLEIVIRRPSLTQTHLELFTAYHEHMRHHRGWEVQMVTPSGYYASFVNGYGDFGYEVLYFEGGKLIGVDLIDLLPSGISSIYFYYDPAYAKRSLGKYSLLRQIQMAQKQQLPWIYLGYHVAECRSLAYKQKYRPLQKLEGRPDETSEPRWDPWPESTDP